MHEAQRPTHVPMRASIRSAAASCRACTRSQQPASRPSTDARVAAASVWSASSEAQQRPPPAPPLQPVVPVNRAACPRTTAWLQAADRHGKRRTPRTQSGERSCKALLGGSAGWGGIIHGPCWASRGHARPKFMEPPAEQRWQQHQHQQHHHHGGRRPRPICLRHPLGAIIIAQRMIDAARQRRYQLPSQRSL
eukprot:COSAG01_NODE_16776_length_1205_cov_1.442134_1_plen_193_part_00